MCSKSLPEHIPKAVCMLVLDKSDGHLSTENARYGATMCSTKQWRRSGAAIWA
jgi:hypothetical protein